MYMQKFQCLNLIILPPLAPLIPLTKREDPTREIKNFPCYKRIKRKKQRNSSKPLTKNNKTIEQCIRIPDGNAAIPHP